MEPTTKKIARPKFLVILIQVWFVNSKQHYIQLLNICPFWYSNLIPLGKAVILPLGAHRQWRHHVLSFADLLSGGPVGVSPWTKIEVGYWMMVSIWLVYGWSMDNLWIIWLLMYLPIWKVWKVSGDDDIPYGKIKSMFHTTNQLFFETCWNLEPPKSMLPKAASTPHVISSHLQWMLKPANLMPGSLSRFIPFSDPGKRWARHLHEPTEGPTKNPSVAAWLSSTVCSWSPHTSYVRHMNHPSNHH